MTTDDRTTSELDAPIELLPHSSPTGARIRLLAYPAETAPDDADVGPGGAPSGAGFRSVDLPISSETHRDALATPIAPAGNGSRRLVGAVYTAQGRLVTASQRGKSNPAWSGNPPELTESGLTESGLTESGLTAADLRAAERVPGRTYFAGHHRHSFGHVLLEVLPRFWPDLDYGSYDTLLFHPQRAGRRASRLELDPYARELLEAATGGPLPALRIVAKRPLRLHEVTVSAPAFWLKRGYNVAVRGVFERVAEHLARTTADGPDGPRRLYLSRSRLHGPERRADNEDEIERLVTAAGFTVVHPQEHPVREQVGLVRSAQVIAGCDGSALHLGVFARPGTRLVALDSRPVPNQFLVDELAGLDAVHVMAAADDAVHGRSDRWRADLRRVQAALAVAGVG